MSIFFFKDYCGMISKFAVIFMVQKYQVRSQNDWIIGWTRLMSAKIAYPMKRPTARRFTTEKIRFVTPDLI